MTAYNTHIHSFISYLQFEKRYSQHTIEAYRSDLQEFFAYLEEEFDINDAALVTAVFVRSWMVYLKGTRNIEARSIKRKASSLKSFFKYLMRQGVIESTPMANIILPKIAKRLPVYVEQSQTDTLFRYVEFPNDWQGKTDKLIMELLYHTGMRRSELVGLKEMQVDKSYSQLKILGKGNKERIVPVSPELMQSVLDYMEEKKRTDFNDAHLLVTDKGKPLYPQYVYLAVKKYLSLVTTINKKSPHVMRHSFATHLTNNGAELNAVKELLGHSSLAATQVYTHNSIEKIKDIYKQAHPKA